MLNHLAVIFMFFKIFLKSKISVFVDSVSQFYINTLSASKAFIIFAFST